MIRVLALTRYGPLGASSRVRTMQYVEPLAAEGVRVTPAPLLDDAYVQRLYAGQGRSRGAIAGAYARRVRRLLSPGGRPDLVWIEKEMLPWVPAWVERLLLAGRRYVLDYDDATFHTYDQHRLGLVRRLYGRKIDRLMRGATLVVAGNAYLAERARRAGARRVEVLPSVIDLERYGPVAPEPDGPFTVGWIGSPGSERLLETIRPVAEAVAREPDTRLVLVGATDGALPGVPHETWPWTEDTEVDSIRAFHVGIMPLADSPWERGKCGFKLIQYMAAGRPVVASPVGVNTSIVANGESGYLASETDGWVDALRRLRADPALRADMGRAGRARAEAAYSLQITAPRLAHLLREAAAGAPRARDPAP